MIYFSNFDTVASGPSSTQWRILINDIQIASEAASIGYVEMRGSVGGANLCTGGTPSANVNSGSSSDAFNPTSTRWTGNTGGVGDWVQYTFAGAVTIEQLYFEAGAFFNENGNPIAFDVQYYNGSTWVTYWSVDYTGPYAANGTYTFARGVASSAGPFRYFRFTILDVFDSFKSSQVGELEFRPTVGGTKLSGTMTASSELGGFPATNANDGNTSSTSWISSTASIPQWLKLDLGSGNSGDCQQIACAPRAASGAALPFAPKSFAVEGSNDNATWTACMARSAVPNTYAENVYKTFNR